MSRRESHRRGATEWHTIGAPVHGIEHRNLAVDLESETATGRIRGDCVRAISRIDAEPKKK